MTTYIEGSIQEFLAYLHRLNIRLWPEGEHLRFSAPPGVMTPVLRAEMGERKAEILDVMRAGRIHEDTIYEDDDEGGINAQAINDQDAINGVPTFGQQRLWFLEQLEPESTFYNIPHAFRCIGTLSLAALEDTLNEIVRRHESLRTTFAESEGLPVPHIAPFLSLSLPLFDICALAEEEREAHAQYIIAKQAEHRFDLHKGPLLHCCLVRLSEREHILIVIVHHIVFDGWSLNIFQQEMQHIYTAYVQKPTGLRGGTGPRMGGALRHFLPELATQYADYAQWQQRWLLGEVEKQQLTYWKEQLAGAPELLTLPTDYPRPSVQRFAGAHHIQPIPQDITDALRAIGRHEHATLFMTLLAAFNIFLARSSGQNDIVVGTPVANRTRPETASLIGLFVNTLLLRTQVSNAQSYVEVLRQVRETALDAYTYQEFPFERLVDELRPLRSLSYSPLFQVMFGVQRWQEDEIVLPDVTMQPLGVVPDTAKFDLTLMIYEAGEKLLCAWEYNTSLFAEATLLRMAKQFETLLEGILADPQRPIVQLPLLDRQERDLILKDWNATEVSYHSELCHTLIEQQVAQMPDAIALVFEEEQISYQMLNRRANQVAQYLQSVGVAADVAVGVCMERSLEMVIALLGILKAGGAYVPLDPEYPQERLRYMLADVQAPVVLVQSRFRAKFVDAQTLDGMYADGMHWTPICLDVEEGCLQGQSEEEAHTQIDGDHLAYIIYTSGSTGKPKGAMNTHRGILNRLLWMQDTHKLTASDRVLQKTPYSFDVSVWEFFWPLLSGATLVIAQPGGHRDSEYLVHTIIKQSITALHFVPSMLRLFLEEARVEQCQSVQRVICSGEALTSELQIRFFARLPATQLENLYGPAEAAVEVTAWTCRPEDERSTVPIGRPIHNIQMYVLDHYAQPVPIGVTGELYIAGVGLARGYLKRPALTAERFLPCPFSQRPGERMYRTGDLARYRADGNLEYLGRADQQVKLRGMRIELGEIEAVLLQYPAIVDCAVILQEMQQDNPMLIATFVSNTEPQPTLEKLQEYLLQVLPAHMVPSYFVSLASIPHNANGKIDRTHLQKLVGQEHALQRQSEHLVAPRTPLETLLVQIWQEVLQEAPIGIMDNFFARGGHSLLATRVMAHIRQALQIDIPLRLLFAAPTIASLAQEITLLLPNAHNAWPPLVAQTRPEHLPLSFAQERLWFLAQLDADNSFYNMMGVLNPVGLLSLEALEKSLASLVQRHEILRTTFVMHQDQPVQVIVPTLNLSPYIIDISDIAADERERQISLLVQQEERLPFDLMEGPLVRWRLLRLSEQNHMLIFLMHHSISDGWSLSVVTHELTALYQAYTTGAQASPLPELPIQYADYALWQRQWLQGEVLQEQLDYWLQRLNGAPELFSFPTDRPRPAVQSHRGRQEAIVLPARLAQSLQELSQREGVTLYMLLLAAYQILLMRYSGQTDILIGMPIANRTHRELEPLIGFFVNMLVIRTDLSENPTFRQVLARVRDAALEAYAHQDLPFEKLVDALHITRSPAYSPLFQVCFVLQNTPQAELALPHVAFRPATLEQTTAKFDLFIDLAVTPQGLRTTIEYASDLFDASTIQRMLRHWQTLLEGIVTQPELSIGQLPLLTEDDRSQLIREKNETTKTYPREVTVVQLFDAQVAQTPDAIALVWEDQQISYGELNTRANQAAHHLQALGVGPEVCVGVWSERCPAMLLAVISILKAGGVYVPLDIHTPIERLRFQCSDAQVRLLLLPTSQAHLPEALALPVLWLEDLEHDQAPRREAVRTATNALSLAYIMYTSGSTGTPKGVAIPQRGIVRLVRQQQFARMGPEEVFLQLAPLAFDASTLEMWGSLLNGGRLVLFAGTVPSLDQLERVVREQGISILWLTAGLFQQIVEQEPQVLHGVQQVLAGGDVLNINAVRRALQEVGVVVNGYGPTENTTFTCCYRMEPQEAVPVPVPIGTPIQNTTVYLLDKDGQIVPQGAIGELFTGGDGLARGYVQQPALTAERFVPDPFSKQPGARLYRTGDLARYREDGQLEFVGRRDQQVKVRGFRIELGEIEAMLRKHPAVQEGVAMVYEEVPGDRRLVAYVVPAREQESEGEAVRENEHIEQWQELYNETYSSASELADPTFNIFGWNSSYTGEPIPAEDMREQVEQTVERILARHPQRVMELGCGTGLLLFRIAPYCREYLASDFSREVLTFVRQVLTTHPCPQVTLVQQKAHETLQVPPATFDTIILNSVIQYFPDIHYMVQIVTDALTALAPGGFLFLGDIRNLALQKAYCTSVEVYRASATATREEVRRAVEQRMLEEEELLIDPAFFIALQREFPQIGQVQLLLKRGHAHNELTRFRYDVIIRKAATEERAVKQIVWNWQDDVITADRIAHCMEEGRGSTHAPTLQIRAVPNKRLTEDLQGVAWVFGELGPHAVKEWRAEHQSVQDRDQPMPYDPEDFWALGERLGYQVSLHWSAEGDGGCFDVFFAQAGEVSVQKMSVDEMSIREEQPEHFWKSYANNPLQGKTKRTLIPQLRSFLKTQLAAYALPSHYIVLETLPLTANGKVDRRALPVPSVAFLERETTYSAPRTPLEAFLAQIWSDVLHVEQVGITDNFFDLGGNSFMLMTIAHSIRNVGITLPVKALFEYQTIAELVTQIDPTQVDLDMSAMNLDMGAINLDMGAIGLDMDAINWATTGNFPQGE